MIKRRKKILINPHLLLKGNMIKCENNTIQISNISRIWMDKAKKNTIVLRKAKHPGYRKLHIQINSGTIYTFVTGNTDIVQRTYDLLSGMIAERNTEIHYLISFNETGEIKNEAEKKVQTSIVKSASISPPPCMNTELMSELHLLLSDYKEKSMANEDIISLIGQTAEYTKRNDEVHLKTSFSKFLELGLINNCNELGLNLLIDEIKKRLF